MPYNQNPLSEQDFLGLLAQMPFGLQGSPAYNEWAGLGAAARDPQASSSSMPPLTVGPTRGLDLAPQAEAAPSLNLAPKPEAAPATPPSGFNWGADNSIWTSLMGLGAGLAAGNSWGSGIGKGIGLAAELNQNRQTLEDKKAARDLQLAMLQNAMNNQQIMQQLGIAGLGLRQKTEERQAETAREGEKNQLTSLGSAAGTWQKSADFLADPNAWSFWGTAKEGVLGSGPIKDAQSQVQQVVEAGLGRKLTKDEVTAYVPQYNDSTEARIGKLARASELSQSRLQTAGSGKTENYRSGLAPIGKALGYVPSGTAPNITPPAPDAAPPATQAGMAGGGQPPPPPPLAGKPLQWSPSMQLFRDKTDGSLYNRNGELVGQ